MKSQIQSEVFDDPDAEVPDLQIHSSHSYVVTSPHLVYDVEVFEEDQRQGLSKKIYKYLKYLSDKAWVVDECMAYALIYILRLKVRS